MKSIASAVLAGVAVCALLATAGAEQTGQTEDKPQPYVRTRGRVARLEKEVQKIQALQAQVDRLSNELKALKSRVEALEVKRAR